MLKTISTTQDAQLIIDDRDEVTRIQVQSKSGIGHADLEITSEKLPERIVLQFRLRGLEELRFAYGKTVVTGSISSTDSNKIRQSVGASGGRQENITSGSPYWMKMRIVSSGTSQSKIPLRYGYIEVEAPEDFLKGNYRKFSIHWVDFFR
jgi:hypothetical protein